MRLTKHAKYKKLNNIHIFFAFALLILFCVFFSFLKNVQASFSTNPIAWIGLPYVDNGVVYSDVPSPYMADGYFMPSSVPYCGNSAYLRYSSVSEAGYSATRIFQQYIPFNPAGGSYCGANQWIAGYSVMTVRLSCFSMYIAGSQVQRTGSTPVGFSYGVYNTCPANTLMYGWSGSAGLCQAPATFYCSGGTANIVPACSCGAWTNGACGGGGCPSSQRYQYRTCTPAGCSTQSQCVADSACNPPPGNFTINVSNSCNSSHQPVNTLTWNKPSGDVDGYRIYRRSHRNNCSSGGGWGSPIATINNGNTLSYNDTGVNHSDYYDYRIAAFGSGGSTYSNTLCNVGANCCPFVDISANKSSIKQGQSILLSWNSMNLQTLNITNIDLSPVPFNQSNYEVFPSVSTEYKATGTCDGELSEDSVNINVSQTLYRGVFIGENIIINTDRDYILNIQYDPRIINNAPPGFSGLLAPIFTEVAP